MRGAVQQTGCDFSGIGVWSIAGVTLLVHLAVAGRYDFSRNELYFIVCGRHPDFGYSAKDLTVIF